MSSAVAAVAPAAPAKSPKKRSRSQKRTSPTVSDLILIAVSTEKGAVSLSALKKSLKAKGYDVVKNKARILTAIKRLVANKLLVQTKGTGASGSFKLNKNPPAPKKKKVVKKKKPKVKRAKKVGVKKAAAGASPAKKSPKKKRKPKTPKKAKKPAAAKKPRSAKKPKSPRKPKRKAVKSTRTRAAAKK